MNRTSIKIIADSVSPKGHRITSVECIYPRIIHAEVMTHRMFSRNAASSRAIPNAKLIQSVIDEPFIPIAWQRKHSGMQGTEYLDNVGEVKEEEFTLLGPADAAVKIWLRGRDEAVNVALRLSANQVTKQLANRVLEPYQYYKVLITATEWENFFELRCPQYHYGTKVYRSWKDLVKNVMAGGANRDVVDGLESYSTVERLKMNTSQAEIHIQDVAEKIWDAMNNSKPKKLEEGEWHIPYGDLINLPSPIPIDAGLSLAEGVAIRKVKIATARCARVSYTTVGQENVIDYTKDIQLHNSLLESKHMSPFEHCAKVMVSEEGWCRNFKGFIQYRSLVDDQ